MSRDAPQYRIGSIFIWMIVVVATSYLIHLSDLFRPSPSVFDFAVLLVLGGLLLILVEWFVTYYSVDGGRLFV